MANKSTEFRDSTTEYAQQQIRRQYGIHERTGRSAVLSLIGPPGVGKTALAECAARETAEDLDLTFVPGKVDPADDEFGYLCIEFSNIGEEVGAGLPFMDFETGLITRGIEPIWPTSGKGIIVFDEWGQEKWAQKHVSKLVSKRESGGVKIPPGWMFVLTGNAPEHRAGVQRTLTHTQNRLCEIRVVPEVKTALKYFRSPVSPEVGVFLSWFPDQLHRFDPTEQGPYPTPRSWDYVNDQIVAGADIVGKDGKISESDFPLVQGYLGTGLAVDFRTFVSAIGNLPNADDMIRNPESFRGRMASMDATQVMAVVAICMKRYQSSRDLTMADAMIRLTSYHRAELVGAALSLAAQVDSMADDDVSVYDAPAYAEFLVNNQHLVQ